MFPFLYVVVKFLKKARARDPWEEEVGRGGESSHLTQGAPVLLELLHHVYVLFLFFRKIGNSPVVQWVRL